MGLKTLGFQVPLLGLRVKPRLENSSWRSGKTTDERGYTYAWKKAREKFLERNPFCRMCDMEGLAIAATIVDHKIPHRGDMTLFWDKTNWQGLCKPHHDGEKQRLEQGG